MNYSTLLTATLVLALSQPVFAQTEALKRKIDCAATADIHVINAVGEITVEGTDGVGCEVDARLGDQAERLEVKERGDRITIEVIYEDQSRWRDNGTRLRIQVPRGASLQVDAVSSDITVEDVDGELRLKTVSGDIDVDTAAAEIAASTTSGDIDVDGARQPGYVEVTSTSGSVYVSEVAGRLHGSTISGSVEVEDSLLSTLRLNVVSGDIDVRSSLTADADLSAEAVSGSVAVDVSSAFAGAIDVSTLNGSIKNCFGPNPQRTSRYGPGRTLRFDHGQGRGRIDITTVNGNTKLCIDK